jgi:hypothetical protein
MTSFAISITQPAPTTRSAARRRLAAETVGRRRDSTGARPPNSVDINGTAPIKEITVTDAATVSVARLPLLGRIERLIAGPNYSNISDPKRKSLPMSDKRPGLTSSQ